MVVDVLARGIWTRARGAAVVAASVLMIGAPLAQAVAAPAPTAAVQPAGRAASPVKSAQTAQPSRKTAVARQAVKGKYQTGRIAGKQTVTRRGKASRRARGLAAHRTRPGRHLVTQVVPESQSFGQQAGLHAAQDPLDLKSGVVLVLDQDTQEVLVRKNDHAVLPIASLTKLMTGLIVSEAHLPLDEAITITDQDVDTEKGSRSRLAVGTQLTRGELMHLALMSSENRAAHALGRTFPGGMNRFVSLMNARALTLGMKDTRYVEPTGLSSDNRSSAHDLAMLAGVAVTDPLLRQFSTSPGYEVAVGQRVLEFKNTNRLVGDPDWQIGLQKTGYITEAGRCLVMQARVAGRKLIMVFLDSEGRHSRLADAERVRRWVQLQQAASTTAGDDYSG